MIEVNYIPTKDMVANTLTKPLPREQYKRYMVMIGLRRMDTNIAVGKNLCKRCGLSFRSHKDLHKHLRTTICKNPVESISIEPGEDLDSR